MVVEGSAQFQFFKNLRGFAQQEQKLEVTLTASLILAYHHITRKGYDLKKKKTK